MSSCYTRGNRSPVRAAAVCILEVPALPYCESQTNVGNLTKVKSLKTLSGWCWEFGEVSRTWDAVSSNKVSIAGLSSISLWV